MPSSYTTSNGIEKPATGEQANTWGDTCNTDFNLIDQSLDGAVTLSLSGTSSTTAITDGALSDGRNRVLICTGALAANHTITITPNDAQKWYIVQNNTTGGFSVIVKQGSGSGSTVTILNGYTKLVRLDGTGTNANVAELMPNPYFGGTVAVGGTLTVGGPAIITGSATLMVDTTINSVDVGRGGGSVLSNTIVGDTALAANTSGSGNTAIGGYSFYQLTTGVSNTGIGFRSGFQNTGNYNTVVGYTALNASSGANGNTGIGYTALLNCTGNNNVAIGNQAGSLITTGSGNVIIGNNTGSAIATATDTVLICDGSGNIRIRVSSAGNVGIGVAPTLGPLEMASGAYVTAGGTWTNASSVALKHKFEPVTTSQILDAVTAMPVSKWEYKAEPGVPYIGPTAQDFRSAFGVGDDTSISTVSAIGVLFAAVKSLTEEVRRPWWKKVLGVK